MPSVAIPGGASPSLGHSLVTAILTLSPHWHPIILSRPSSPVPSWLTPLLASKSVSLVRVNYADHSSLVAALKGAHTVISILGFTPSTATDGSWFNAQIALLNAAKEADVKRFAPPEFGIGVKATPRIEMLAGNVRVWEACEAACADGKMEWTRFECGLFMNYLGFGVPAGELREEALGGRERDGEWFYYTSECRAELPIKADGKSPRITMMAIEDVGRFVARSLDLPAGGWETTSYMVGETLPMDEVVRIAERVMGKRWEVKAVSLEELERSIEELGEGGDASAGRKMWAELGLCYTKDVEGEGWLEGRLNGLFPDVNPLRVEEYLRKYYG